MAACRGIALFVILLLARAASAATIGVAWDPSPESGITGYRVYVSTTPGSRAQFFDVGPWQTSYLYTTAIEGRYYYFSVASMARGVIGFPSEEVFGLAGTIAGVPSEPSSAAADTTGRVLASVASRPAELATGLGAISSLSFSGDGIGLFIEAGSLIRVVGPAGLAAEPALQAGAGDRFVSLALDPAFASTRHVYVAVQTRPGGGQAEIRVERHRLAGGRLGETATIASGLPATTADVVLTVSTSRHILLAQPGSVTRLTIDGSVPRDQTVGSPTWGAIDLQPRAAHWDDRRAGLWVIGDDAAGNLVAKLVQGATVSGPVVLAAGDDVEHVSASSQAGSVYVHLVSAGQVASVDLESGSARPVALPPLESLVGWTLSPAGDSYAVVTTGPREGPRPFALMRVVAAERQLDALR